MGSSASSMAGSPTSALAMATLCYWPPDSSLGLWCIRSSSPSIRMVSRLASSASFCVMSHQNLLDILLLFFAQIFSVSGQKRSCSAQSEYLKTGSDTVYNCIWYKNLLSSVNCKWPQPVSPMLTFHITAHRGFWRTDLF